LLKRLPCLSRLWIMSILDFGFSILDCTIPVLHTSQRFYLYPCLEESVLFYLGKQLEKRTSHERGAVTQCGPATHDRKTFELIRLW